MTLGSVICDCGHKRAAHDARTDECWADGCHCNLFLPKDSADSEAKCFDVCTCGHPKSDHHDHPLRRCRICETCPSYELYATFELLPPSVPLTDPLKKRERNTRRDNPSWLCGCGCACPCGCWTCADGYHCAGDNCPHADGRVAQNRCPDCGAFAKPMWLPKPSLGTDPNWHCKNCGSRT